MVNEYVAQLTDQFKAKLCDAEKCPSEVTLRTYAYSIAWLKKRMDFPEDGSMPKPEHVLEYMENAKIKPQRKCQVYTALKKWHGCSGDKCSCEKYGRPLTAAKHQVDNEYAKQGRTKRQRDNWVEHAVLKKFAGELRDEVVKYDKNAFWDKEQFIKAQLAFILLFHLKYPIRRDLATVQWGKKEWGPTDNYIDPKTHQIVLQKHKTSRWRGTSKFTLSRVMWRIWGMLRLQQKKREYSGGHMILNKYYRPMTPTGFTSWMTREMKRCPGCEKKAVGCMLIRHCCITHERRHEKTIAEKKAFADKCMHSVARNEQYRVH